MRGQGRKKSRWLVCILLLPGIGYIALSMAAVMGMAGLQSFGFLNLTGKSSFTFAYWMEVFDRQFLDSFLYSVYVGTVSSIGSMVICYPVALFLSGNFPGKRFIMPFVRIPLFVPALVATFLIINVLDYQGLANAALMGLHIIDEPLRMRNDDHAIGVLLIQLWKNIPFQLVIVTSALESIRTDIKEAARNLGASRSALFRHIILPLTIPSALVAIILVFIGTFGDFAVTSAAGPIYPISLSMLMHQKAYLFQQWNSAACIGMIMITATVIFIMFYTKLAATLERLN